MTKHIAVYFSGRSTGYEHCYEQLKRNFYDQFHIDFFWSIDEEHETDYYKEMAAIYQPKRTFYHRVDKQIVEVPLSTTETRRRNSLSMFLHNFKCTEMIQEYAKENKIVYHAIVRFRAEIQSNDSFKIEDTLMKNTLYIPKGYNYRGVSDRVAYGDMESMILYGNLYKHISNYVYCKQALFNPEYLLMFHINENNMNLIRFTYVFNLHPDRHKVKSKVVEVQAF